MNTTPDERVEKFAQELMKRASYVKGNQYHPATDEHKAYESGFSDALGMVYIDLTGTPKSKGMLAAYRTEIRKEIAEEIGGRMRQEMNDDYDGGYNHACDDIIASLIK